MAGALPNIYGDIGMADGAGRRLSAEVRSAAILEAAKRLLDRSGVRGFSLEAVAREAGVAASLPRHYFGGSVELLSAATVDVLKDVERALRVRDASISLETRFSTYLDLIQRYPWGHSVWMRSAEIHPSIETLVRKARIRLGAAVYRRPWSELSRREQIFARGWVGFVEAVISDWIERDFSDRELVLDVLMERARTFQAEKPARGAKGGRQAVKRSKAN